MDGLKRALRDFLEERAWDRFHEPKDLALAIAIEAGELGEHFLWKSIEEAREHVRDPDTRAAVLEELADVMIYCINMANAIERLSGVPVDIDATILAKIARNREKYPADVFKNKARLDKGH